MTTVLHIDASAAFDNSVSRAATARLLADLAPEKVITRDLATTPLPQIDAAWINARLVAQDDLTATEREILALSDTLIAEVKAADVILIGMPMYNFGMPAALKAWIDLIARPKVTFAYTPDGPVGLLENKRAVVAVATGGVPVGAPVDFATPHLTQVLNFIGIKDVDVQVAAEVIADKAA